MLYIREFLEKINTIGEIQNISSNCESNNYKLYGHQFGYIYPGEVRYQVIEKALRTNFKKVYVCLNFKNSTIENSKRNNLMYFELALENFQNSVIITSCKSMMYLNNSNIDSELTVFFETSKIPYINKIIENDLKNINKLNFRKPLKINRLESWGLREIDIDRERSKFEIDIINSIYNKESSFKLETYYMLFGNYAEHKKLELTFDNYDEKINNVKNMITEINNEIGNQYKEERKLFNIFKQQKHLLLETVGTINEIDEILDILPKIKELNKPNNNKESIFDKFMLFKLLLDRNYSNLQPIMTIIDDNFENVKLTKSHCNVPKFGNSYNQWGSRSYISFDFKKFKMNIPVDQYKKYNFEKVKNLDIFFNLLELIMTDEFKDILEKESLKTT